MKVPNPLVWRKHYKNNLYNEGDLPLQLNIKELREAGVQNNHGENNGGFKMLISTCQQKDMSLF